MLLEPGAADIAGPHTAATVLATAAVAHVGVRAALAAAYRDQRLWQPGLGTAKRQLERAWLTTSRLSMDSALIQQAGALAAQDELRGDDAAHLAALIRLGPPDVVGRFACWDRALRAAARDRCYQLFPT